MSVSRHDIVDANFTAAVGALHVPARPSPDVSPIPRNEALGIFESMMTSRHLDLEARRLKGRGEGFYTIGSSGHECNAAVAAALHPDDPCFLHYRSGAFMIERARRVPGETPIFDTLLSLTASREDPASGGRHKVWGSKRLFVPPQTSTIASHLPKAVGAAFAIDRARRIGIEVATPPDAIVVCSFGDASANHSTAVGAFNAARWANHQRLPLPLLFVCEDNSFGISVRTPSDWIRTQYGTTRGMAYFHADGLDLADTWSVAREAVALCRRRRVPVFLHLELVRLMGHAGSDVEIAYRSLEDIAATESSDPLVRAASWLVSMGWVAPDDILTTYEEIRERVHAAAREAARRPKLSSRAEVMAQLAPYEEDSVVAESARSAERARREQVFGGAGSLPEASKRPRHMAMLLNWALHDLMAARDEMLLFGEDVAKKGGVYHVTHGLSDRFGVGRVFNTLLDEQTILGLAIGAAHLGYLPCPEIQYLAYLVNAADQLRGEAASLQFFSNGQFANPMVVRIAGMAYQKGFGGHFHNDNGLAFLREIPGLVIAVPARGDDAVGMLRTSFGLAKSMGRVVAFVEPIALYMTKDLHEEGDGGWSFRYPSPGETVPIGRARVDLIGEGRDLTIITFGNGTWMSLRVARRLLARGISTRVVDLRWLAPLPREQIIEEALATGRVLVVDEGRRTGGVGEAILAELAVSTRDVRVGWVAGADCFVPLAAAANLVLVSEGEIEEAAVGLAGEIP